MTKSKLIKDITTGDVSLINALERLLIIIYKMDDSKVRNWLLNEINGYGKNVKLPDYRKSQSMNIKYDGINGNFQVKNVPLPLSHFPEEVRDDISSIRIIEGISVVEKIIKNNYNTTYDFTRYAPLVYERTGIQCLQITSHVSITIYEKVYNRVRSNVIQILLDLEHRFGKLDDLDIDIGYLSENDIKDLKKSMVSIISDGKEMEIHDP